MGTAALVQQARIAIRERRLVEARRLLRQAIHEDPQNHVAWLLMARATPDGKLAREYVQRAQLLQPDSPLVQRAFSTYGIQSEEPLGKRTFNWRIALALAALAILIGLMVGGLGPEMWEQYVAHQNASAENLAMAPAAPPVRAEPVAQMIAPDELPNVQATPTAVHVESREGSQQDDPQDETKATPPSASSNNRARIDTAETEAPDELAEASENLDPQAREPIQQSEEDLPGASSAETLEEAVTSTASDESTAESTIVAEAIEEEPINTADAVEPDAAESAPGELKPGLNPGERWIDVNLTTQTLVAYEGDTPVLTSLISSGMWQFPTVTGEFRTWLKYESQDMSGYHLGYNYDLEDVPYVMYFYRDFAIHGAYWHNNFGTPMSHGCVNMNTIDAGWLFDWAPIGTLVNVHY